MLSSDITYGIFCVFCSLVCGISVRSRGDLISQRLRIPCHPCCGIAKYSVCQHCVSLILHLSIIWSSVSKPRRWLYTINYIAKPTMNITPNIWKPLNLFGCHGSSILVELELDLCSYIILLISVMYCVTVLLATHLVSTFSCTWNSFAHVHWTYDLHAPPTFMDGVSTYCQLFTLFTFGVSPSCISGAPTFSKYKNMSFTTPG